MATKQITLKQQELIDIGRSDIINPAYQGKLNLSKHDSITFREYSKEETSIQLVALIHYFMMERYVSGTNADNIEKLKKGLSD